VIVRFFCALNSPVCLVFK